MPTELKDEKYFSFKNNLTGQFNDANNITSDLLKRLQTELKETYQQEIEQIKQEAILHFNNLARLSVEEKQKWIESEKEKIKLEKVTANEIASEKVEISKQAETTNVILDSISNDIIDVNATTLIKIEVTEKAAYASLVAYWFSTCFSECKSEIENKSIGSMIIDLQRHAKNTGQRLEVKGIIYHEFLKAK
jgi:Glu-tRNA(Gln) amidotransferase subunit E-like FAD-binding protein